MNIHKSTSAYETWLSGQLHGEIAKADLREKHKRMRETAFVFLRATYWRWAERIPQLCPDLNTGPTVLAIGDVHVENFGTWRDEDGRVVWGVNDFDEAAEMPYTLDLLRLVVSAFLGQQIRKRAKLAPICAGVLKGFRIGLERPRPYILDKKYPRMRGKFVASEAERQSFWDKMHPKAGQTSGLAVPESFKASLDQALPDGSEPVAYWPRTAGVGSLGRPRWVVLAKWKGGPVVREAKALVPSGWSYARRDKNPGLRVTDIANGRYRAPDPWFSVSPQNVAVRRLSPNNHKIEMDKLGAWLFKHELLEAMGREIASIHLGTCDLGGQILRDIETRPANWLAQAAEQAVECTMQDFQDWKKA